MIFHNRLRRTPMFVEERRIGAPDSLAGSAEMSDAPYLATTKASSSQKVPAGSFFFEFRTFREGRRVVAPGVAERIAHLAVMSLRY